MTIDVPSPQTDSQATEQALRQAIEQHQTGKLQEAETRFRAILQLNPNQPEANFYMGVLAMQRKQVSSSLPYFEMALNADPARGYYWLSYIDALFQAGQLEVARQILALARQHGLDGEEVDALEARLDGKEGVAERPAVAELPPSSAVDQKSIPNISKAKSSNTDRSGKQQQKDPSPQEVNALVSLFNQGRFSEAITVAKSMTVEFPQHWVGWKMLGVVFQQMGRDADALLPMQKAAALSPGDAEVHNNLGIILQNLGRLGEAEASYRRSLKINPNYAHAHGNLGATLQAMGRMDEAEASYRCALKIKPDYAKAHGNLGAILKATDRLEEAEASFKRAIQFNPDFAEEHSNESMNVSKASQLKNRVGKSVSNRTKEPSSQEVNQLVVLIDQGRNEEAVSRARVMTQQFSLYAEGWKLLGVALKKMERNGEALNAMQKVVELTPNDAEAHKNMGVIAQDMGLLDEAVRWYRLALQIDADYAVVHGILGGLFQSTGRLDEALYHFQERARLKPGNVEDQHLIASLTGKNTERAPVKYVEGLFNFYAGKFDTHLQQELKYNIPKELLALILRHTPNANKWDVLDLGCGTGLVGVQVVPFTKRLVGVDLSTKMLEQAKARKLYQRLEQSDLLPMMREELASSYDVIVAADVFVYLGKLNDVIAEVKRLLRPGGVFAFSVEDCEASASRSATQDEGPDYQLKSTGRYGQSAQYLARLASVNGLDVRETVPTPIRSDHGAPIAGHIGLWKKAAASTGAKDIPLTTDQLLDQAVFQHQAGQLQDAERLYREILKIQPGHSEANHNMGALAVQSNRPAEGLPYFTAALEAEPARGLYWNSYIDALHRAGQTESAREILAFARQNGLSGVDVNALEASFCVEQAKIEVQPKSYCPVCGSNQVAFFPLPESYLKNIRLHGFAHLDKAEMLSLEKYTCNCCGASDRERLYALWVDQQLERNALRCSAKVLHFAPEAALSKKFRQLFSDYQTADFGMGNVDHKIDIQNLPFADASYDLFICSHVLEHVESDDRAIRELYRITKIGGCGILVAPIIVGLEETLQDPSVTDAAGRWRLYGQDDHVRLYAHDDYVNKIRSCGFSVAELGEDYFGEDVFHSLGLTRTSILYVVSK
jgi:predicted TPR repeat methyltransferase/thioredoxin-like negative regulator of GroEL